MRLSSLLPTFISNGDVFFISTKSFSRMQSNECQSDNHPPFPPCSPCSPWFFFMKRENEHPHPSGTKKNEPRGARGTRGKWGVEQLCNAAGWHGRACVAMLDAVASSTAVPAGVASLAGTEASGISVPHHCLLTRMGHPGGTDQVVAASATMPSHFRQYRS